MGLYYTSAMGAGRPTLQAESEGADSLYKQLKEGCADPHCNNMYCYNWRRRFGSAAYSEEEARFLAIEIAQRGIPVLCTLIDANHASRLLGRLQHRAKQLMSSHLPHNAKHANLFQSFEPNISSSTTTATTNDHHPSLTYTYLRDHYAHNHRQVSQCIFNTFSKIDQLIKSFVRPAAGLEHSGINYLELKRVLLLICAFRDTLAHSHYYYTFLNALDILLVRLAGAQVVMESVIRCYILLLNLPTLNEGYIQERILSKMIPLLGKTLSFQHFRRLIRWIARDYHFKDFELLVTVLNTLIARAVPAHNLRPYPNYKNAHRVPQHPHDDDSVSSSSSCSDQDTDHEIDPQQARNIINPTSLPSPTLNTSTTTSTTTRQSIRLFEALNCLLVVHMAYNLACYYHGVNYSPEDIFYNEELCEKLNLKLEYLHWDQNIAHYRQTGAFYSSIHFYTHRTSQDLVDECARAISKDHPSFISLTTQSLPPPPPPPPTPSKPRGLDFLKAIYAIYTTGHDRHSIMQYPFILTPLIKSKLLQMESIMEMSTHFENAYMYDAKLFYVKKVLSTVDKNPETRLLIDRSVLPYLQLEIRRDRIVEDTFNQLADKGMFELRKPLKIKFVESGEQGMDLGGVQKEFFQSILTQFFHPDIGMFILNEETQNFWINAHSSEPLSSFELFGTLIGLAAYNGVLVNLHLPFVFYKKLLGCNADNVNDLKDLDMFLHKSLISVIEWDEAVRGPIADTLCYTFQISHTISTLSSASDSFASEAILVDLVPHGEHIEVTESTKMHFVKLYADYVLNRSVERQIEAVRRGFYRIVSRQLCHMMRPEELESIIIGTTYLNLLEMKKHAVYENGYSPFSRAILWFWEVVGEFSETKKRRLLFFITGTDRIPLQGMSAMVITIQRNGEDIDRLPTAMTCFSRLLLPDYPNKRTLMQRLSVAIENDRGFGLV